MDIKRREVVEVFTTDNKPISVGDTIVVFAYGKCHIGCFQGLSKRNALILTAQEKGTDEAITYVISDKCVDRCYKGDFKYED